MKSGIPTQLPEDSERDNAAADECCNSVGLRC